MRHCCRFSVRVVTAFVLDCLAGNILYLDPANTTLNESDIWHVMRNNGPVQYTLNMSITYRYVSNAAKFERNNILETVNEHCVFLARFLLFLFVLYACSRS
jgi:trehalose utilization protein